MKEYLKQAGAALAAGVVLISLMRIIVPFDTFRVILPAVLEGAAGILLIWLLYIIIKNIRVWLTSRDS